MKTTEQNQKVNNKVFVMKEMDTKFQALLPKRVDGIFKGAVKVEWHKWDDGFRRMSGPDQEIDRIPAEKCPEALRQSDERYYLNRIKTFLTTKTECRSASSMSLMMSSITMKLKKNQFPI